MKMKNIVNFTWKSTALAVLILITTIVVSTLVVPISEEAAQQDQGQIMLRMFIIAAVDALLIGAVITQSRWCGVPLVLGLTFAFYGVQTVIGQMEAYVFLTPLGEKWGAGSIPAITMPVDFITGQVITGAAVALISIPLAVALFKKWKCTESQPALDLSAGMELPEWILKLGLIMLLYILLYFGFGYYVAWKNPAVTDFYQGTDPGSFLAQMKYVATQTPTLIPFQGFRALLWAAFALPVIRMLQHKHWGGALLTGLFLSLPMNIPHIIPNEFMPPAVRTAHFVETVSSTFIFGVLMFWLLHRSHSSAADFFRGKAGNSQPQ
jgi:hypothetical protein